MPLLAAALDFLMTTVGYGDLDDIFAEMLAEPSATTSIGRAANRIAALLHDYLGDHLESAHHKAKFHRILGFLEKRSETKTIDIDDQAVLDFWCDHSVAAEQAKEGDFRTFRTVFETFVRFLRALEFGRTHQAMDRAAPIGANREAGEIDLDQLGDYFDDPGSWASPLPQLGEDPTGRIKFLYKKEKETMELLLDCGPMARRLPISLLRSEVFGKAQSRITQALRNRTAAGELCMLINTVSDETYQTQLDRYGIRQTRGAGRSDRTFGAPDLGHRFAGACSGHRPHHAGPSPPNRPPVGWQALPGRGQYDHRVHRRNWYRHLHPHHRRADDQGDLRRPSPAVRANRLQMAGCRALILAAIRACASQAPASR